MELLCLWFRRVKCFLRFIGTKGYFNERIGPIIAWRVATNIHPPEDVNRWWLYTGWMGPGSEMYLCPLPWQIEGRPF